MDTPQPAPPKRHPGRPRSTAETRTARLAARITPTLRAAIDRRGGDAWVVALIERAVKRR